MNPDRRYRDNSSINLQEIGFDRPRWIGISREAEIIHEMISRRLSVSSKNISAFIEPGTNTLRFWKEIYSKNMATLTSPANLANWHKKYVLALNKHLDLLEVMRKRLTRKDLKKTLKKLKAELLAIEKKKQSEEKRIEELNQFLEQKLQEANQPAKVVENNDVKPKDSPQIERISKKTLIKLLAVLGLKPGANSKDIEEAYKSLVDDKKKNPSKYSESEWNKIEEAHHTLSQFDDKELEAITTSNDQLTVDEGSLLLQTLELNPEGNYSIEEIDQAFLLHKINNALSPGETPDTFVNKLYQSFINQTDGLAPQTKINLTQLNLRPLAERAETAFANQLSFRPTK